MIFDEIKDIIIDQLQVEESEVTMDTNLMKDLSADSLDAVEIIMAIEEEYLSLIHILIRAKQENQIDGRSKTKVSDETEPLAMAEAQKPTAIDLTRFDSRAETDCFKKPDRFRVTLGGAPAQWQTALQAAARHFKERNCKK